jgi:hypothetical protein
LCAGLHTYCDSERSLVPLFVPLREESPVVMEKAKSAMRSRAPALRSPARPCEN